MFPESLKKSTLLPALIGAGLSIFFIRSGFFSFFFLVPLGFVAFKYDYRIAWNTFSLAVLGSVLIAIGTASARGISTASAIWDNMFFVVMSAVFTWIIAPSPNMFAHLSPEKRFIAGSCAGALLFIGLILRTLASPVFLENFNSFANAFIMAHQSFGPDVVRNAMFETLTPEMILNTIRSMLLRGGSLIICVILFFVSHQISHSLVLIIRKERVTPFLSSLKIKPEVIWILSISLLLVLFTRIIRLEIPEIILWNVLVLCVIMYFAQGLGIMQFFIARPSVPGLMRVLLCVLFFILLFSPVINVILLTSIIFLGIAENWVPFRASKSNGPPSTPEAGDN